MGCVCFAMHLYQLQLAMQHIPRGHYCLALSPTVQIAGSASAAAAVLAYMQARFDYPVATFRGRDAVTAFWTLFLLQRATQLINVYGLHIDMTWDPVKLQALVQVGCHVT